MNVKEVVHLEAASWKRIHGARLDAVDAHGDSPLTWASWHLRPDAILRQLCYDGFSIHPARRSTYDHGAGWEAMGVGRSHPPAR